MKKRLAKLLYHLAYKLSPEQVKIINARKVSEIIVDKWITFVDNTLNTSGDGKFKLEVTTKKWYGFEVLKDIIHDHILRGEEVK